MDKHAINLQGAKREMEQTILLAVRGALYVFEKRTGLQPSAVKVDMIPYGPPEAREYELDFVQCTMPETLPD